MSQNVVVIPTLNEEEGIGRTLREIKHVLGNPKIIVVDAHSEDRTVKVASRFNVKVILQEGFGKGKAVSQAFQSLEDDSEQCVVLIDGDYSYPAKYIPKMVQMLREREDVAMVLGERFFYPERLSEKIKKLMSDRYYAGNHVLALIHRFLNHVNLKDPLSGLRVIKYSYIKDYHSKAEGFDFEVELNNYIANQKKGKILEVPLRYRERLGKKKLGVRHGFLILNRIVTMMFEN